jgi:hypothetical protein
VEEHHIPSSIRVQKKNHSAVSACLCENKKPSAVRLFNLFFSVRNKPHDYDDIKNAQMR